MSIFAGMSPMQYPIVRMTLPGGIGICVPDNIRLMTPFVLHEQGDWFEAEMAFVRRWLEPGMAVVDIGANYGCYSLTCAGKVGSAGRVWSYEPASLPRTCLAQSIGDNAFDQIQLSAAALSDRVGTARLGIADNAELNSLSTHTGAGEEVALTTLDLECRRWDRSIDFLKLDAEGEEVRILAAASEFFAHHDPLVMFEYKHGSAVNHGLIEAIQRQGMTVFRLVPGLNVLVALDPGSAADQYQLNLFACRGDRVDRLRQAGLLVDPSATSPALGRDEAEGLIQAWAQAHPGVAGLSTVGPASLPFSGSDRYRSGLAHAISSEDAGIPAAVRFAHLSWAVADLEAAATLRPASAARWYSLARVTMAMGQRGRSVEILGKLNELAVQAKGSKGIVIDEPFLPPDPCFDQLRPQGQRDAALLAMIDEPLVERCAFSLYFVGKVILPVARRLAANPLRSRAVNQRLATMGRVLPPGAIVFSPLLTGR